MALRAPKLWPFALLGSAGVALASGAALPVGSGGLGAGQNLIAACDSGAPTVTQNIGSAGDATNVVSVSVSGLSAACATGLVKVTLSNGADPAQEATQTIPSGGGTVNLTFATPVALKEVHFVAVSLQGP
jgi:hypothetical protein